MATRDVRDEVARGSNARPRDVARALAVSPAAIYKAIERGEIEVVRIGRSVSIPNAVARRLIGTEAA